MRDAPALGNYRKTFIDAERVWVSTIYRESSAMAYASPYFETMAFPYSPEVGIYWQSSAGYEREADRQHDLAVRYFSRPWRVSGSVREPGDNG